MRKTLAIFIVSAMGLWADSIESARQAMYRGDYVSAEQMLSDAIVAARHSKTPTALDPPLEVLAELYQRQKKFSESAAAQQRRIDMWTELFGPNTVVVGRILGQLAAMERATRDLPSAEDHSRASLAIMTAAFPDQPPAAQAAMDLADILLAEDRTGEAADMLAMAHKIFESSLGPQSMMASTVASRRVSLLRQLSRVAEADRLALIPAMPVFRVGKGVVAPRIQSKVEPKYSEEARKKKLQGSVAISLVIDETGAPTQIAILRPLGMGLDEMAIAAISQWKFMPGTKDGSPVPVFSQVEMTFYLL